MTELTSQGGLGELAEAVGSSYNARPSSLATSPPRVQRTPSYTGITIGASVIRIFGILCLIPGILLTGAGLAAMAQASQRGSPVAGSLVVVLPVLGPGLGLLIAGIMMTLWASLALAIRDIAKNSFRR